MIGNLTVNKKRSVVMLFLPVVLLSFFLTGCLSTSENDLEDKSISTKEHRATLADLTDENISIELTSRIISREKRAEKLARLYQEILSLNPSPAVRRQIEYRTVQLSNEHFENSQFAENNASASLEQNNQALAQLIVSYRTLLIKYPDNANNENVQYQLAKALDLQGRVEESLVEMDLLLQRYPQSKYSAELNFRRGDIHYNFQEYDAALNAYQAVLASENNEKYQLNSQYMSAWSLFKLTRLAEADSHFIQVLSALVTPKDTTKIKEKYQLQPLINSEQFSFSQLGSQHASLAEDVLRVLSISFSQQQQARTLIARIKEQTHQKQPNSDALAIYQHVLFENLANFLIKKELKHEAELTYQAYIDFSPNSIWSARFSLNLLTMYKLKGDFPAVRALKAQYVGQYGLSSSFWQQSSLASQNELLPQLNEFSYQHSRRLYARSQNLPQGKERVNSFVETTQWLNDYLAIANTALARNVTVTVGNSNKDQAVNLLADEFLYADANFEAQFYLQALHSYENVAYGKNVNDSKNKIVIKESVTKNSNSNTSFQANAVQSPKNIKLRNDAAYATTLTIRKILVENGYEHQAKEKQNGMAEQEQVTALLLERSRLDELFIKHYPDDVKALAIASHNTQYAFDNKNYASVKFYSEFVLQKLIADNSSIQPRSSDVTKQITSRQLTLEQLQSTQLKPKQLMQVQLNSQLQAHSFYQQGQYADAEKAYVLALVFENKKNPVWQEMRNLLASSIYFQGQQLASSQPKIAVAHFLRVGLVVPESISKITAEFDAANLLLANHFWQQAVGVLTTFQQHYPKHKFSASIPAKLSKSYQELGQWSLAAEQLLIIVALQGNGDEANLELKREAQYSAGQYYEKSGNLAKAIDTFRTYAHTYPEPFDAAQEVRYKMSEFYRQTKEPSKRYFWYRKIIKYHNTQVKSLIKPLASNDNLVSGRSTFLASTAALGLGKAHQQTFNWVKLTLPLNKTLKRKQKAMKQAIGYFQQVLSYQLAEFVPQATYQLAEMYRQLAADVMSSQRPTSLDELALEEYEFLLEDIAYPFEDKAIEIHASNAQRTWKNVYDQWIAKSFTVLAKLDPVQYNKVEREYDVIEYLY